MMDIINGLHNSIAFLHNKTKNTYYDMNDKGNQVVLKKENRKYFLGFK
jgi:hypothetical protein